MTLEFHHLYIFVPRGAPQMDELVAAGFCEGSRNSHPGQGTENRRVFFRNGMLEFIWVENPVELTSALTAPTRLLERSQYQSSGFSPFGVCLCSGEAPSQVVQAPQTVQAPPVVQSPHSIPYQPFEGWAYRPSYLPPGISIWQGANDAFPWEPAIFYLAGVKPYGPELAEREPIHHANGAESIKKIRITMRKPSSETSAAPSSSAATTLKSVETIELRAGDAPFAEIEISGSRSFTMDLGQKCPLRLVVRN
jgi:hypothetical protein